MIRSQRARIGRWASLGIGAGAATAGLLPWLVHGMRMPVQNLGTGLEDGLVLLPFSQYALTLIAALLIEGAAIAGIASRAGRGRFGFVLIGMLVVQAIAVVQTAASVAAILRLRSEAGVYLALLVLVSILAILIGAFVALLVARAPRAGAVVGLAIAAVLSGAWLGALFVPPFSPATSPQWLLLVLQWTPPVLVGVAIAWGGVGSVGRVFAAIGALAILWVGPALITAVSSAAGSRVLAHDLAEMRAYAVAVFRSAVTMPELVLRPLALALVVAAIGIVATTSVRARRRAEA